MAAKKDILDELDFVTTTLSTQVRTTALGVLALSWGLLIGESSTAKELAAQLKWHLVGVGAAAVLILFLDFLQYVAGYAATLGVYNTMVQDNADQGEFDDSALSFRLRMFLFYAKMVALSLTVIWLLVVLGRWLIESQSVGVAVGVGGGPMGIPVPRW